MGDLQENISGVGNTGEEKLNGVGIETVNELANASLETVEKSGIRSPEKILDRAQKQGIQIDSGMDVEEEEENARYISTGMQELDGILGGGLRGGYLIGVAGEPKVGKTQSIFQLLASAVDFTDGHAIYIETEPNRFSIGRIKDMSRKEESYKRVHRIQAYSEDDDVNNLKLQKNAYDAIKDNFDNVSIVAVDSFVANFRMEGYSGRGNLPERNEAIRGHLQGLQSLANDFNCPVLMALQVMGNPDAYSGGDVNIWGPTLMDHTISYLLFLSHAKGELKEVELKGNASMPDDSVLLKVPEDDPMESMES